MLPVWVEIHVDDEILERDPRRFKEAHQLVNQLANTAETAGARLCFRFRETFARLAIPTDILPQLAARGHEIGVHAHGKRLIPAARAVQACGIQPEVAVPGLVQVGHHGRRALLRQVASLGMTVVTDHGPSPAWAYEGLEGRVEEGVLVMAPTVRPFDWGLMETDGTRHGVTPSGIDRLRALEAAAASQGAHWFGLALHEHDLCPPGSLHPDPGALAALGSYLDARVGPALASLPTPAPAPRPGVRPLSEPKMRLGALLGGLTQRARRSIPTPRRTPPPPPQGQPGEVHVGDRTVATETWSSGTPQAVLALCHAGTKGGRTLGLQPFGLTSEKLTRQGWVVWAFDRSGTGRSPPGPTRDLRPGNIDHVADWIAVLEDIRKAHPGVPVVALSWSAGIVPVLRAAESGHRPDALIDGEAPADRWSLSPPPEHRGGEAQSMRHMDPWEDAAWAGREPRHLLQHLARPYARLQAAFDHVHGPMTLHSDRMVTAAQELSLVLRPPVVGAGRLHDHPAEVMAALQWARDQVLGVPPSAI